MELLPTHDFFFGIWAFYSLIGVYLFPVGTLWTGYFRNVFFLWKSDTQVDPF